MSGWYWANSGHRAIGIRAPRNAFPAACFEHREKLQNNVGFRQARSSSRQEAKGAGAASSASPDTGGCSRLAACGLGTKYGVTTGETRQAIEATFALNGPCSSRARPAVAVLEAKMTHEHRN